MLNGRKKNTAPYIFYKDEHIVWSQLVTEVIFIITLWELARLIININDQITVKGIYTEEANRELEEFRNNNKQDFIDVGCTALRPICSDVCCAVFAMTRVLSTMKITDNSKINFA